MTAPDIVTEARRVAEAYPEDVFPPPPAGFVAAGVQGEAPHPVDESLVAVWVTPDRFAAHVLRTIALPVVTELVAEVERLRHELDQRTNPELAARLVKHADTAMRDSTTVHGYYVSLSDDLLDAARLLGGDR